MFLTISGLNKEGKMPMRRFLLAIIALSALCVNAEESGKSAAETKEAAEAVQPTETATASPAEEPGKSAAENKEAAEAVQSTEVATASPVEFYVGVSVGHDRMTAKRTENVVTGTGAKVSFSDNTQTAIATTGKAIAGFLWTLPNTPFVLSPEIYIGSSGAQLTLQESVHEPALPADKIYQSTFKQRLTMGLVLRAGFYLTDYNNFLYGLIGKDRSKFENQFKLNSTDPVDIIPTLSEKNSQYLKSTVFGVGFERKFNSFKLGIEHRHASYSAWNSSKTALVSLDKLSMKFKPKIASTSLTFCYLF